MFGDSLPVYFSSRWRIGLCGLGGRSAQTSSTKFFWTEISFEPRGSRCLCNDSASSKIRGVCVSFRGSQVNYETYPQKSKWDQFRFCCLWAISVIGMVVSAGHVRQYRIHHSSLPCIRTLAKWGHLRVASVCGVIFPTGWVKRTR